MDCYLFVGPTRFGFTTGPVEIPAEITLCPPARRDDLTRLVAEHPPASIALVDGLFYQSLAIGHAEIRTALKAGWRIWGLSSLGAIRAYEMRTLGMQGFGQVYARFCTEADFQDDEVALLHGPEPPYTALTEPLVHLRCALEDFERCGWLSPTAHQEIVTELKSRWYGDRTLRLLRDLTIHRIAPKALPELTAALADFDRYRIKSHDLTEFLHQAPWRAMCQTVQKAGDAA